MVAASDCERCREGLVTQPANAASSLAYVAAGADLLRGPDPDRAFAWALIGVGVGSVAYHGPGGRAGRWLHDATLITMLGLMATAEVGARRGRPLPSGMAPAVASLAAVGAHPRLTEGSQAVAGAAAAVAEVARFRRSAGWRALLVGLPLWTTGATLQLLGRTDKPWCRPDSPFQAHAGWHLASAAALWARGRFTEVDVEAEAGLPGAD